jgi:hypothetical protein
VEILTIEASALGQMQPGRVKWQVLVCLGAAQNHRSNSLVCGYCAEGVLLAHGMANRSDTARVDHVE